MFIKFSKMHGLGNDFVIINNLELRHQFTAKEIEFIANRRFGVGCDQVLIIDCPTDGVSDFFYRIYNSDGSIAGQCGNGARCFIRYVTENSLTQKQEIRLQTLDRAIVGSMLPSGLVKVDMGVPEFHPNKIPFAALESRSYRHDVNGESIEFFAVSMGNPHAVVVIDSDSVDKLMDDRFLTEIAVGLQGSCLFPEGVNVNFMSIINENNIQLRTYERGCGFTLACGSGACASAAIAIREGWANSSTRMIMPGGELTISWNGVGNLFMCGEAALVFNGELVL